MYHDPNFPLIDLHRHLDGNVRLETIIDLSRKHNLQLPAWDIEGLRPYVQVMDPQPGVMEFISKFHWMIQILVDYDSCWRIAYENVQDAKFEGLDYVELRFSPFFMSGAHHLDPSQVVKAVCDGVEAGEKEFGVKSKLIGIISRTYGPETGWQELRALLSQGERIAALDLAGDEANFPAVLFKEHFFEARKSGWHVIAHAGESSGPESIWQAVMDLKAERIGHAVTALKDSKLIEYLREHQIAIECNLTSNLQTSTVPSYLGHPLRRFMEQGLLATINTDDPGISGIDLIHEYEIAAPAAGLSQIQIRKLQENALQAAFLSDAERTGLVDKYY